MRPIRLWRTSGGRGAAIVGSVMIVVVIIGLFALLALYLHNLGIEALSGARTPCDCSLCHLEVPTVIAPTLEEQKVIQSPCRPSETAEALEAARSDDKVIFNAVDSQLIGDLIAKRKTWSSEDWEHHAHKRMQMNLNGKYVITAVANFGHANFTLNWIASLQRNRYARFVVFCLDFLLYEFLLAKGLDEHVAIAPSSWTKFSIAPHEHRWSEESYYRLTEAKLRIQRELLYKGYWIIFSDVDLVFLSSQVVNHIDFTIGRYCGSAMPTQCFTDFAYMIDQDTDINTGFFAARPTALIKEVFDQTVVAIRKFKIDQLAFNHVIRTEMGIKYSKNLKPLDKFLYTNGFVYFRVGATRMFDIKPLVVHANYVEGSDAKQQLLASNGMWYI